MKVYTLNNGVAVIIQHASALPHSHGHKMITCSIHTSKKGIAYDKDFSAVTDNMPEYDNASDLEGQEKYESLFEIIRHQVEDVLIEWLDSQLTDSN